ncbi:Actin associated WSP1 protein [Neofusicoccum parvum]|uniref:Actin associated WSP1 protein n=1 Tax=Neofusicoccum parvum TaxID=310453 RepID=A0ACB5RUD4_9PEZI|nr:Actin associated WSP1 protein [Neofusicoccum parvum]
MPSILSDDDKQTVKRTVPKGSNKIHAVAVAKLYIAYPNKNKWTYTGLQGAAVLANDLVGNTFWIKLVDISPLNRGVIWDQEIYDTFSYNQDRTFFHTFELEQCLAGLSFADEKEAKQFKKKVDEREKNAHKNTKSKPFGMAAGTSNGSLFGHKHSSPQPQQAHSIIPPKEMASPASSSPNQSGRSSAIDTSDPSWQGILQELLAMGITEDQIEENADFIKMYIEQKKAKHWEHLSIPTRTASGPTASAQKGCCSCPANIAFSSPRGITTATAQVQSAASDCRCGQVCKPGSSAARKSTRLLECSPCSSSATTAEDRGGPGSQVWSAASICWSARCIQSSSASASGPWACPSTPASARDSDACCTAASTASAIRTLSIGSAATSPPENTSSSTVTSRCPPASTARTFWPPCTPSASASRVSSGPCSSASECSTSTSSAPAYWRCASATSASTRRWCSPTTSSSPAARSCRWCSSTPTPTSSTRSSWRAPATTATAWRLKKVDDSEKKDRSGAMVPGGASPPPASGGGAAGGGAESGLAGALASALAARKSKVSHSDDEDDKDDW